MHNAIVVLLEIAILFFLKDGWITLVLPINGGTRWWYWLFIIGTILECFTWNTE